MGISLRKLENIKKKPSFLIKLIRNLFFFIFPFDCLVLLNDQYARRIVDKRLGTIILEKENVMRVPMRILLGNIIFFSFFVLSIFIQKKTIKKTSAYKIAEKTVLNDQSFKKTFSNQFKIQNPEINLNLSELNKPSKVKFYIGTEKKFLVTIYLLKEKKLNKWKISKLIIDNNSIN